MQSKLWLMLGAMLGSVTLPAAQELARTPVYAVAELRFNGPMQNRTDTPARDIQFRVRFRHESGAPEYWVQGFWDGDGRGGMDGNVFKVRFCPTRPGRWTLVEVQSNRKPLAGQRQGDYVTARRGTGHGFWEVDPASAGRRWYRRSDGSHPYIIGNTHYTFLSGYGPDGKPVHNDIARDIVANAIYFKKLRFSLGGGRYPHPVDKPFLDDAGRPTDDGNYSHRPNPKWFHDRVDLAVRTAFQQDLIADLILCGPDTKEARATLQAGQNHGDPTPWLRYLAARYGSYPNVWMCLANEFNIKSPRYTPEQIARWGRVLRGFLPYPTPLSVHTVPKTLWPAAFDSLPPWNDHQIIQVKLRNLTRAADVMQRVWRNPGGKGPRLKPTVNDELSYQGAGDKHSEGDTIEALLGAFLGGGYGTTGFKPGSKLGHYFWGKFDPAEHTAADNLKWLRETIDAQITFWHMAPDVSLFDNLDQDFRGLAWAGQEYVLGTNRERHELRARLPAGTWRITRYDLAAKTATVLGKAVAGGFTFDAPDRRSVMFHFKRNPAK